MKWVYKFSLTLLLMIWLPGFCLANNIEVSNVKIISQNIDEEYSIIEFDITWENSWRYAGGPANWDAAWIFVKYRVSGGTWKHALLNNTGHVSCADMTLSTGLLDPNAAFHATSNPGLGVFLYRTTAGTGDINCTDIQLRWNYGSNSVPEDEVVDIKVFAIEHVYIREGSFKLGSGGNENSGFYTPAYPTPYQVNNENAITIANSTGNLYYNSNLYAGDQLGPLPAAYPKGFNDFYIMKYEISQKGYVDFLNTLSRFQQNSRVRADVSSTSVVNDYVLSNTPTMNFRNGVWTPNILPISPGTIIFYNNFDQNTLGDESGDGQNIACNYLLWHDIAAYLDWAGLRPITELEFEKAARGPREPVPNEHVWGNNFIYQAAGMSNSGFANETVNDQTNISALYGGPIRCGALAKESTDRTKSGASYYGVLDMEGNVYETVVSVGTPTGRSFQGHHGNGLLTGDGQADVTNWPNVSSFDGVALRGGHFNVTFNSTGNRTSDRFYGGTEAPVESLSKGGRGGRTAPQ